MAGNMSIGNCNSLVLLYKICILVYIWYNMVDNTLFEEVFTICNS